MKHDTRSQGILPTWVVGATVGNSSLLLSTLSVSGAPEASVVGRSYLADSSG